VGPTAGLYVLEKRNIFSSYWESNSRSSHHYTDYEVLAVKR